MPRVFFINSRVYLFEESVKRACLRMIILDLHGFGEVSKGKVL